MKTQHFLLLCLACALPGLAAAQPAADIRGMVYDDVNANGTYDRGDKPLKGVAVSDGLNVTTTDAHGRYALPHRSGARFVSVSSPSGYMAAQGGHYHALAAGSTANSLDFALRRYDDGVKKNGAHKFLHISDTEIFKTTGNELWRDDIRAYAANEKAAFIVHTGDICYENGLKKHIRLMNSDNMQRPVYYCIGNHDLVKGNYGEELFESLYGPTWYSFNAGNVHYIVTPMLGGDHRPGYTADEVCRWLRNDLATLRPGTPVVVFNHDLPTTGERFIYKGENDSIDLNAHHLKAWIYGHLHINHVTRQGNVLGICTSSLDKGGIDHAMAGYRVLNVDGKGGISSELRYAYLHNHLAIAAPQGLTAAGNVVVNAYSSLARTASVTYSCTVGGKTVVKDKALAQKTDWTWTAPLPARAEWQGKPAAVDVKATFADGTHATASSSFAYHVPADGVQPGADWDNLCGNAAHTGSNHAVADSTMQLIWSANVGSNVLMASPLIHDGKVFIATVDENLSGKSRICALDIMTGAATWEYTAEHSIKNTIAIACGNVIAQDVLGNVYAIRCADGSLAWQRKLPTPPVPSLIDGIATEGDVAYTGTGQALTAFHAATGEILWQGGGWHSREGTTTTIAAGGGVLITGSQWSALYGNDAATGRKLWQHSDYGLRHRGASAAIHGGLAYILSDQSIFVLDARSGRIIVRHKLPVDVDATSTPLLTPDGKIVFGTSKSGIMALDAQTFEVKWQKPLGKSLAYTCPYTRPDDQSAESSAVAVGNMAFIAAADGCIYGLDTETGTERWKYATGAPFVNSVAVSGNALVACDYGGNVYLFANARAKSAAEGAETAAEK